jgi:hypothetical protein
MIRLLSLVNPCTQVIICGLMIESRLLRARLSFNVFVLTCYRDGILISASMPSILFKEFRKNLSLAFMFGVRKAA